MTPSRPIPPSGSSLPKSSLPKSPLPKAGSPKQASASTPQRYDPAIIAARHPIAAVIGASVALKQDGQEFIARCPFHDDRTPSFTVVPTKGFYHCFGCGAHGDVIDFVMARDSVNFKTACLTLEGPTLEGPTLDGPPQQSPADQKKPPPDPYADIRSTAPPSGMCLTAGEPSPPIANPKRSGGIRISRSRYTPSMVHGYRDAAGALIGYVLRIELDDRRKPAAAKPRKITPTVRWAVLPNGEAGWCLLPFDRPRPLYNLDRLAAAPTKPVLIVEGEKTADAGAAVFDQADPANNNADTYICMTRPGGTGGVGHADWSVLHGRRVTVVPDADAPGDHAACEIAAILRRHDAAVTRVAWDRSKPLGWDLADAVADGWTASDIAAWMSEHIAPDDHHKSADDPGDNETAAATSDSDPSHNDAKRLGPANASTSPAGYTPLGHGAGSRYFYLCHGTEQIVELAAAAHTRNALMELAPPEHWLAQFPTRTWERAAHALMAANQAKGVFDPERQTRGRGAWLDTLTGANGRTSERAVLHYGPAVYVDGIKRRPSDIDGDYVYERAPPLNVPLAEPATTRQAHALVDIAAHLTWERDLSAVLLAGFCVVAPVCGILEWRPHIWITGPSGSGKTTVVHDIVRRVLGPIALYFEGDTTEAGLRQILGRDARPVILDEAEAESEAGARRMRAILSLTRKSSSGAELAKGTASGRAIRYLARSCFCFSAINPSFEDYADASRISKLTLRRNGGHTSPPAREAHYRELKDMIADHFDPAYAPQMLARSIAHMKTLRANAATFTDAAAAVLGDRRAADQVGTLLAGYHLCFNTQAVDFERACAFIEGHDWTLHTAIAAPKDEERLLNHILTHRHRFYIAGAPRDVPIGDLISYAAGLGETPSIDAGGPDLLPDVGRDAAMRELRRLGIWVHLKIDGNGHDTASEDTGNEDTVSFCNGADPIRRILKGTPWAATYGDQLRHHLGAKLTEPRRYAPGLRGRGSALPLSMVVG